MQSTGPTLLQLTSLSFNCPIPLVSSGESRPALLASIRFPSRLSPFLLGFLLQPLAIVLELFFAAPVFSLAFSGAHIVAFQVARSCFKAKIYL